MDDIIIVSSFDGLYDEKAEAVVMDINHRKVCIRHAFINGSLRWDGKKDQEGSFASVSFESPGTVIHQEWGQGYGGIRYCKRCKFIDCIHFWEKTGTYEIKHTDFYSTKATVAFCSHCRRKVLLGSSGDCHPGMQALALIHEVVQDLGKPPIQPGNYGSYWLCEWPCQVAEVLQRDGAEQAKEFIRASLGKDGSIIPS